MTAIRSFTEQHDLILFYVMTFAFSWILWLSVAILGIPTAPGAILVLIGAFGPSVTSIVLVALIDGRTGLQGLLKRVCLWRVGVAWYCIVLFLTAIVALTAILIDFIFRGAFPNLAVLGQSWFLVPAIFLQIFFLGGPLQEELGWRGYALPRFQEKNGALVASLVIGLFWALWHLPLFWIPYSSQYGLPIFGYLLHFFPLAILFTWVYNNTRGSLLIAMIFHAAFNVTTYVLPVTPQAAGDPFVFYVTVVLLWVVATVVVLIFGPSRLSRNKAAQD
jgi:membrane protease YdiL (CAAX protease family)